MPASQPKSFFPLPEAPRMPRRRPHVLAKLVSAFGILGILVLAGLVLAVWNFDLNSYKPRVEAAIRAATGRDFAIHGRLAVVSWFTPTIAADDVVLANPPQFAKGGAAQPAMLKIARVEADLAIRPLLSGRLDIARLVLIAPDLRLETAPDGTPNWHFTPAVRLPPPVTSGAPVPPAFAVRTLHVKDGRVFWRHRQTGATTSIEVKRLSATEHDGDAQIQWGADLLLGTASVQVAGQTGSLVRLLEPDATTPWSVYLRATLPGARFTVAGTLRQPWRPAGYDLLLDATIADPAAIVPLADLAGVKLPGLPPLRRIVAAAHLVDPGGVPTLSAASLRIGPSDLRVLVPGLQVDSAEIAATAPGQPAQFTLRGSLDATPLQATGTLGTLANIAGANIAGANIAGANTAGPNAAGGALPIDATLILGDNRLAARGTLGAPATGEGADLLLSGRIRDLTVFAPLAFQPLPPLEDVSLTARLRAAPGGWAQGFGLPEVTLLLPQGDIAGTLSLTRPPVARPHLALRLRGSRLDLDALARQLGDYHWLPLPPGPPVAALPFARTIRPLISDTPLDIAPLALADADIALDFGELDVAGLPFKDVSATIALKGGVLLADPVRAQLPGGPVELRASLDSSAPGVPVALRLRAPGLSMRPLLERLGRTEDVTGTLSLDADLTAAGRSPHAWAASATGHLAAAIVDGSIDNAVLAPPFSGVLRVAHLSPDLMFGPGRSHLRCAALRLDSAAGKARLSTLLLDADRALVQADGTVDFGPEAMEIRLRPTLYPTGRIGSPGLVVPLTLRGSFRSPVLAVDEAATTGDVAAALAEAAAGRQLRGAPPAPGADQCAAALAVVRGVVAGPAQGGPPPPAGTRPAPPRVLHR